jgi:hypothetical protein
MDNFDPVDWLKDQIEDWLGGQDKPEKTGLKMTSDPHGPMSSGTATFKYGDFMMRPGQSPVSFSPSDTIIGAKDLGGLFGGGGGTVFNVAITINGTGLDERQLKDAVETAMEDVASRQSRNGSFQRGY